MVVKHLTHPAGDGMSAGRLQYIAAKLPQLSKFNSVPGTGVVYLNSYRQQQLAYKTMRMENQGSIRTQRIGQTTITWFVPWQQHEVVRYLQCEEAEQGDRKKTTTPQVPKIIFQMDWAQQPTVTTMTTPGNNLAIKHWIRAGGGGWWKKNKQVPKNKNVLQQQGLFHRLIELRPHVNVTSVVGAVPFPLRDKPVYWH